MSIAATQKLAAAVKGAPGTAFDSAGLPGRKNLRKTDSSGTNGAPSGQSDRFKEELAKLRSQLNVNEVEDGHGATEPLPGLGVGSTARISVLRRQHDKVGAEVLLMQISNIQLPIYPSIH